MLERVRRRRRLSMTSLIDVIFLLLLFFMLTSTFTKFTEVELFAAQEGQIASSVNVQPLFLRAKPSTLSLNGSPVTLSNIASIISEHLRERAEQTLLISLHPETNAQRLTDIFIVLRQINGLRFTVLEGHS